MLSLCRTLSLLIFGTLLWGGCSGFVGQRVGDFRAYYNTFYNAQQAFDEATRSLDTQGEPIDHDAYLSLYPGPERVTAGEALERAIEKSADVLREHPGSKWVDGALLLIGKSYFYQGNFAGAEQKFREVIERESRLGDEARVWLARALIRAEKYEEAGTYLRAQLEEGGADRAYRSQLDLLLGELHVQHGRWEEAAQALAEGLKGTRDDRLAGRARFLLGQVYETLERYDEAAEAYRAAADGHADYELTYAAQVGGIRALGHTGRAGEALERLQRMEHDGKYADRRPELALLRGELYRMQDRPAAARQALRVLLYGEELDPSLVRGQAHYALGVLYRDAFEDYLRAAAHFDTAATALERPAEGAAGPATPVAITDGPELAEAFGSLAEAARRVERLDSLLHLGGLDEEAFEAFVADLREQRTRELQASRRAQEERAAQQRFTAEDFDDGQQQLATAEVQEGAGFLFYRDPTRVQEARAAFVRRWGRRPRAPNWRRLSAVAGGADSAARRPASAASAEVSDGTQPALPEETPAAGGEPLVDVAAVPRDSASRAAMRAEQARARYELGNALFLTAGRPDSAAALYRKVIAEGVDERAALQARYALGEVARARGDTAAAREHYRRLVQEHPTTELAARVQARLSEESEAPLPAQEAPAQAEQEYAAAYEQWQRGQHAEALQALIATAARYSRTEVAPRALLAAGTLYLEWARRDTIALHAPLPVTLPDSLLQDGGLLAPPLEASTDTTTVEEAPPDTTAAEEAPPDTMANEKGLADTTVVNGLPRADSLFADEGASSPRVEVLFASVAAYYPDSPQADRARRVLKALEERPPQVADTAAIVPDTSASGGEVAVPDTSVLSSLAASVRDSLLGGDDLDRTKHSWTIAVGAEEERAAADTLASDFRMAGYRAGVLAGADTSRYRVGVGQFAEEENARAAFKALGASGRLHRMQATGPSNTSLYGETIDRQAGGWTLVVASEEAEREAEAAAEPYREAGYRVGVFSMQVEGATRYRVGVGQFATQEEAAAAREDLSAAFPGDSWLLQVPRERN